MSSKSRHGKRKHSRSKRKERQAVSAVSAQQPMVSKISESITPSEETTSPAVIPGKSVSGKTAASTVIQYPYIKFELRRIGILAGIILVILVILATIFS